MRLLNFLKFLEASEPYINAHREGSMVWIDMMHVPPEQRGAGSGRAYYEQWEAALPQDIEYVRLVPVDSGGGPADGFWEAMGYNYLYSSHDPDYDVPNDMVKGVNDHPAPGPLGYEPDELTEAPVRDFEVDPSVNQYYHGTWGRRDQAMLGNPKMADIATKRIKTAIPIDMHFAGVIQMDRSQKWMSSHSQNVGRMTDTFRQVLQDESGVSTAKAVSQKWGVDIVPAKDAITVLYMSNTNDVQSAIPITPWIMTHRLGHSLEDAARAGQLGPDARGAEDILTNSVVNGLDDDEDSYLHQPITPFLTMKSATTHKLDEGEANPEMIAQYLHSGRVRLARAVAPSGNLMWKMSNGLYADVIMDEHGDDINTPEKMNKVIEQEEQRINQLVGTIVKAAVGLLVVAP